RWRSGCTTGSSSGARRTASASRRKPTRCRSRSSRRSGPSSSSSSLDGVDDLRSASRRELHTDQGDLAYHALTAVPGADARLSELPHTLKILLENLLRRVGGRDVSDDDLAALAAWPAEA